MVTIPSARMLNRLRAMGIPLPPGATIQRTYAGHIQRAAAAWSWCVEIGAYGVGSQLSVGTLLAEPRLMATRAGRGSDWHVDRYDEREARWGDYLEIRFEE